jgi:hypothetical protein
MQIFLAPRSNETSHKNFLSTIENGVDFSIVEPYLADEGKQILSKYEKLFVWATEKQKKLLGTKYRKVIWSFSTKEEKETKKRGS